MLIGVPREIMTMESRVGLTPGSVRELVHLGHSVMVETGAGKAIDLGDELYARAGAEIVATPEEIYARAEMVVKVKEPQASEFGLLRAGQILFAYLHLAPDPVQTEALLTAGVTAIAYETVVDARGGLPLLAPMSEVAGRMAIQAGARCLEIPQGGKGVLLGGAPGVPSSKVVILGGGVVGGNAARMALGLEAHVTVIDRNLARLQELDHRFNGRLSTVYSTHDVIESEVATADLVIGAVLVPGAATPKLVTREMVRAMRPGSVMVDVAIDQGGCFETSRLTSHAEPTYSVDGVVHYCVGNMPGAVARTATFALNNATLPCVVALAEKGHRRALSEDPHLRCGLNVHAGRLTHPAVALALGYPLTPAEEALRL